MTEYDSIEEANAQIEFEMEDYRDTYDHHSAEDIEAYMPEYRVVPSHLEGIEDDDPHDQDAADLAKEQAMLDELEAAENG